MSSALLFAALLHPYHTSGLLKGSLIRDEPAPVYSPDPGDPWNRIHHLLFTTTEEWSLPTYYLGQRKQPSEAPPDRSPEVREVERAMARLREIYGSGSVKARRIEGGDLPDFFFTTAEGLGHLLRGGRYLRLVAALENELKEAHLAGRMAEAQVLLQNDLWNRFDALGVAVRSGDSGEKRRRWRLRALLGRLIARVALSDDDLRKIRPNLPEIAEAHPEVERDLVSRETSWRELLPVSTAGYEATLHSRVARFRRVFRIFMRVPDDVGGPACLEASFSGKGVGQPLRCNEDGALAYGSRVLLVETLLALSDQGEIVPVPLVIGVQSRLFKRLAPGEDGRLDLVDLPFVILHGSRVALSSGQRIGGGLTPLDPDEPVPPMVGCLGAARGGSLLPARLSCLSCHGATGRNLMRSMSTVRVDVRRPDNTLAEEAVIRAKRSTPEYQSLREFFRGR